MSEVTMTACTCWGETWCTHGGTPVDVDSSVIATLTPDGAPGQPQPVTDDDVPSLNELRAACDGKPWNPFAEPGHRLPSFSLPRSRTRSGAEKPAVEVEARAAARKKLAEELRADMRASQQVIQAMIERACQPLKLDEKYVSYDAMPEPLQRVVAAYIAVSDAHKELDEAIRALQATELTKAAA